MNISLRAYLVYFMFVSDGQIHGLKHGRVLQLLLHLQYCTNIGTALYACMLCVLQQQLYINVRSTSRQHTATFYLVCV